MPFQTIPDTDVKYALINFDDEGRERTENGGARFSSALVEQVRRDRPSHIFLFSHGWKGDVPSAIDQYNRWIGAMWRLTADRDVLGSTFRPLFIGLHWPSQPWGDESLPATQVSFATTGDDPIQPALEAAVRHFGGSDAVRRPLQVIFDAYRENPGTRVLSDDVVKAYHELATAVGFSAGAGADSPPDEEGAPLDPQAAVRAERMASAGEAFGLRSTLRNGVLAGLRQVSFWVMKHRARTVGEQGMHQFVTALQQACDARIHLMGHSFGCIVVSSILGGPGGTGALARAVDSAVLVQGALSLWSFADKIPDSDKPGYFRRVLAKRAVAGPLVTTQSTHDAAVGAAFPAAVGLVNEFDFGTELPRFGGVGTWGIQGTSIAESSGMLDQNGTYSFKAGRIYNVDGSRFISGHSAIDGPEVAHLLWQAVAASPVRV
ncbi:MAG TPA: hypothetical protein VFV95_20095 [Vicinamibacterales bacterium]|nr:hypothetical protein [Vicinamibacterales bacterium]